MNVARFASRKFLLALLAFLASCGFLLGGRIDATQWVDFVKWVVALYLAGNVADRAVGEM